ncbi:MAG: SDR family NAD(P)-dependent oxidoreductase [Solirubrobacteraceae bacterium]
MSLPAPTVIVTGGSGGLGRAIVSRLLADGMRVVVADINAEPAAAADERSLSARLDVTDPDSVANLVADVRERWGPVTVLVNNAGIAGPTAAVADYPTGEWKRVLDVNLSGAFHCMRACLPDMVAAEFGRIVNIASIAGKDGNPWMSATRRPKRA